METEVNSIHNKIVRNHNNHFPIHEMLADKKKTFAQNERKLTNYNPILVE